MPTSDYHQISVLMHVIDQLAPKSILEIGVGFGKWGVLCRELLEIGHGQQYPKERWTAKIHGIEIFSDYRNPIWSYVYDEVFVEDAKKRLERDEQTYDLVMCLDVIEHFPKEEGRALLNLMLSRGKSVLLSSPLGFTEQGAVFGNEHERHLSGWGKEDFEGIPHHFVNVVSTFVCLLSRDPKIAEGVKTRRPLDSLGFKKGSVELGRVFAERVRKRLHGQ